ncbi:adenylyltransferase/cytidyltransferase family protein [Butyrivibrio sp. AC2005]|uniref:adenylyltransferase/cytidyltransferase family protein n=1 Tax=Butyrivibrio sp. AC2005 TaxID=1280672 RepID=UPI0003F5C5DF|nr:adenylyltransferase/cytidyltransferase family protein [Butyrivibrio sp. AC2005]
MNETHILKELKKGLIAWYDFRPGSKVLYIGDASDAIAEYLTAKMGEVFDSDGNQIGQNLSVVIAPITRVVTKEFCNAYAGAFDYVICVAGAELVPDLEGTFNAIRMICSEGAVCLFGMNNRMGVRYFCGDRDIYTDRNFDGVEGYKNVSLTRNEPFAGRMYDKAEIRDSLVRSEAKHIKFYSLLSDLDNPILMFAEGFVPKEDLTTRLYPVYNYPKSVFLEEEVLYKSLVENDMFHQMANAYLVEFSFDDEVVLSDALQITSSMVRSAADAMITIIHSDDTVEKINVYPEGKDRFSRMLTYAEDLKAHGLKVVPIELTDRGVKMPYIDAPVGQLYLKNLFLSDMEKFFKEMDHFRDLILLSSDHVGEKMSDELGVTLKRGYIDLVPLNSFYIDGDFVFFDQEFREDKYPANAIIARMVSTFYAGGFGFKGCMTRDELYARYGLAPKITEWRKYEIRFLNELRNDGELGSYYKKHRKNGGVVSANRFRLNFSTDDYYRFFINIFDKADTRKLILFGSGKYATAFMEMYGRDYPVYAIVDNDEEKWGTELEGVKIYSSEYLKELDGGEYKVMICIKNYMSIMHQLDEMGVVEYSVYDATKLYPKKRYPVVEESGDGVTSKVQNEGDGLAKDNSAKKYHVGYIAGVFDLIHVGHLNMFKKAKEYCDYLIVGVVTDEGAAKHNHKKTFVPFEERIEMVRACRYVDEAVRIPVDQNDTQHAFEMYHFDVQFSGSDYVFNQSWLNKQKWLREHGADLVFFQYTQSTNSSSIKALIEKELIGQ